MTEQTFGMIKPEGMAYSADIESRIEKAGLFIDAKKKVILTGEEFELIYASARARIPQVFDAMKQYMTSNLVMVLRISGQDACQRLLTLRGASNAADARPGTIRGDYASNQDYRILYREGKFAKNVFHAADRDEAKQMLDIFFGGEK